jgi:hypothetical protein
MLAGDNTRNGAGVTIAAISNHFVFEIITKLIADS